MVVPLEHDREQVRKKACRIAGIRPEEIAEFVITRKSLDARKKKDLTYSYTVEVETERDPRHLRKDNRVSVVSPVIYAPRAAGEEALSAPIAVIGTGPAGLFCALLLAENGYRPFVFERGRKVEERTEDVERFWMEGKLDPNSNVQFGEGGAGTFSDGKLHTAVRDKEGRNRFVLETFVRFGASEEILYEALPHIGSDCLTEIIANMRNEIIRLGGRFFFSTEIADLELIESREDVSVPSERRIAALLARTTDEITRIPVEAAVFAIGHSARDTFAMLNRHAVPMEAKPFAVGLRVEHPQNEIDLARYGDVKGLPPASYKLTYRAKNGRSVYSFCMCPGGYVVNASSQEGGVTVNGMSNRLRDSGNANSAIVVSVTPEDFSDPTDPLTGVAFQQDLEERAYRAGGGKIPQQLFGAYAGREDAFSGSYASCTKGAAVPADIRSILPAAVREALVEGMHAFSRQIKDFDREDAILSAVESRTSSPVRILRGANCESSIRGLYPCGEGAGYAGGIVSAAMDGLKVAEALMARYKSMEETDRV